MDKKYPLIGVYVLTIIIHIIVVAYYLNLVNVFDIINEEFVDYSKWWFKMMVIFVGVGSLIYRIYGFFSTYL